MPRTPADKQNALPSTNYASPRSIPLGRLTLVVLRLTPHWDSLLLFLAFLSLYTLTLAPGLLPADSGEFQLVVPLLGIAHPPGFPLYILLGKLFISLVRLGDYAYRLNLFSAFTSSLTLVLVNRAVRRLTQSAESAIHKPQSELRITHYALRFTAYTPGLLSAALLGLSTTFWSQATTANIRSLMALLTALAVYAFIEYRLTPTVNRLAFFLFSLSLAVVHHLSIAFIAAILVINVLWFTKTNSLNPLTKKSLLKLVIAGFAPFFILLYLPIRGAQAAALAPPGLTTLNGFLQHALGLGFGGDFFYFANPIDWPDRFAILLNIFQFQFNDFALSLLALGLILFFFKDWKLAAALTLAFAVHCFVAITYRAPQTVEYLLPAYVILVIASAAGLTHTRYAIRNTRYATITNYALRITFYCSLFFASLVILLRNYPAYTALARDTSTRDYAASALTLAPPDAIILSNWHYAAPMWYLQEIEGLRRDVEVQYVFPQGTSLALNWVDRINTNVNSRPTLVTNFYPQEYTATSYNFPHVGLLWQADTQPLLIDDPSIPLEHQHEGGWSLITGGAFGPDFAPGQIAYVTAMWRAPEQPTDINFFVQLLGPDGLLYGQMDVSHPAARIAPNEVLSDRYDIIPNLDAQPGPYRLVAGAYLPNGTRLAPDFTDLAAITIAPRTEPPATLHPSLFGLLAGYDYDLSFPDSPRLYLHWRLDGQVHQIILSDRLGSTLQTVSLPALTGYTTTSHDLSLDASSLTLTDSQSLVSNIQLPITNYQSPHYIPFGPLTLVGSTLTKESDGSYRVDLEWLANKPITADLVVKVDLVGENYAWRDQSDSVPAGGAIPTLKWIPGIIIRDRHHLKMLQPTPATFQLAVYDHFTQRNLPILDSRLAQLGPTVPLGTVQP